MIKSKLTKCSLLLGAVLVISNASAACFPLEANTEVLGQLQFSKIKAGDNFTKLAQKYDVGYDQLQAANPRLDSENPLVNAAVVIPTEFVIPKAPHKGLVINLAQMRIFYFPKKSHEVCTYPVGIGKENWQTPEGRLFIMQKIKNPVWIVPDSIMKYRAKRGDPVPKIMQSGPDNPLGYFAMRLSKPTFLIHGTNEPNSIGRRSSAGCIHLFGKDIAALFKMVPVKTKVTIVNQPYMLGQRDGQYYFAAFKPLQEMLQQFANNPDLQQQILQQAIKGSVAKADIGSDMLKLRPLVMAASGIPEEVNLQQQT